MQINTSVAMCTVYISHQGKAALSNDTLSNPRSSASSRARYRTVLSVLCHNNARHHQSDRQHNGHNKPNLGPLILVGEPHVSPRSIVLGSTGSGAKVGALDDAVLDAGFSGSPSKDDYTTVAENG